MPYLGRCEAGGPRVEVYIGFAKEGRLFVRYGGGIDEERGGDQGLA